jgi:hypothetical protein
MHCKNLYEILVEVVRNTFIFTEIPFALDLSKIPISSELFQVPFANAIVNIVFSQII